MPGVMLQELPGTAGTVRQVLIQQHLIKLEVYSEYIILYLYTST